CLTATPPTPPTSPPSPHTTLFGSRLGAQLREPGLLGGAVLGDLGDGVRAQQIRLLRHRGPLRLDLPLDGRGLRFALATQVLLVLDRKSTRLNSSHVKSSYAVCCLK